MTRRFRPYPLAVRLRAIEMLKEKGLSVGFVSKALKVPVNTVAVWGGNPEYYTRPRRDTKKPLLPPEVQAEIRALYLQVEVLAPGMIIHVHMFDDIAERLGVFRPEVEDVIKRRGKYADA